MISIFFRFKNSHQLIIPWLKSSFGVLFWVITIWSCAGYSQYLKTHQLVISDFAQEQKKIFKNGDFCIIPEKYDPQLYSETDLKAEEELCLIDFLNSDSETQHGICGKIVNTNPGLDIFKFNNKITSTEFEKTQCPAQSNKEQLQTKKIAKFKQSISCSYTPSLLAYYHTSRILGGILNIPPSVLRTIPHHYNLTKAQQTYQYLQTQPKQTIRYTWANLIKALTDQSNAHSKYLMTSNSMFSFGALIVNPRKEKPWSELSNDANGIQIDRAKAFQQTQVFKDLNNLNSVEQISRVVNQENLQKILMMGDVSDMLIIDTLLKQEDRYNNIAFIEEHYLTNSENDVTIKKISSQEIQQAENAGAKLNTMKIRRVLLKDNDCGVASEADISRTNINLKTNMLSQIAHMKEKTYKSLLKLALDMTKTAKAEVFFKKQTLMTSKDYAQFKDNTLRLAKMLYDKCQSGQLKLDLNEYTHFDPSQKVNWTCAP